MITSAVPQTKVARHAAITKILRTERITSQSDLRKALAQQGINTTQATLSRDLFELHATKVRGDDGKPAYVLRDASVNEVFNGPENGGMNRLTKWCQDLLVVATYNGNFVILRTPAGAAQLMASSLDNSLLPEMMGCVAGDDTVLIMCTDPDSARRLTSKLLALADDTVTDIE